MTEVRCEQTPYAPCILATPANCLLSLSGQINALERMGIQTLVDSEQSVMSFLTLWNFLTGEGRRLIGNEMVGWWGWGGILESKMNGLGIQTPSFY